MKKSIYERHRGTAPLDKIVREAPILLFLGIILTGGCAKLQHLDQLLTLKEYSQEGEGMAQYVEEQDQKFEFLLETIHEDSLRKYSTKSKILKAFGEPVYVEKIEQDDQILEQWLYRRAKGYIDEDKIYLYLNDGGELIDWEYVPSRGQGEDT